MQIDWVPETQRFPFPQKLKPFTVDERGIPFPYEQCNTIEWFLSYLNVAVGDAYGKIYSNFDGLADSFCNYWERLASEYGHYESVMGYDLMNGKYV